MVHGKGIRAISSAFSYENRENSNMNIRSFRKEDWMQVKEIYEQGIATGQATFETTVPSFEKWESTIAANLCLVAENEEGIQGWCKISKVSSRCVYEGVGEVSVYVRDVSRGKGVGKQLLQAIIKESEEKGFWTLTAGIFLKTYQVYVYIKVLDFVKLV